MNPRQIEGIIVDAGHGGIDSGATGNNLLEKNLNLKAAQYMYDRFIELGIPAKMTRIDDEYLPKEERIRRVLELYDNSPNTILISNHINAGGGEGAEVVYSLKNNSTLADLILDSIGDAGQIKRKTYQRRLPENPNKDYYYILRETGNTEPVLVEYGFIDNPVDASRLQRNLTDYAEAVVKAVCEYLGYPYYKDSVEAKDFYIVQRGDTLYSISRKFNIPIDQIKTINRLDSDVLSIGQKLYLSENMSSSFYIVKKGDTLYSIALENNTTVDVLKSLNGLTSNILKIGQELQLPVSNAINIPIIDNPNIYIVQKGDTFFMGNNE